MEIPFRRSVVTNIGSYVLSEYENSVASAQTCAQVAADSRQLQLLRTKIEVDTPSLAHLRDYYHALVAVERKVNLSQYMFTWKNALDSQSLVTYPGLEFEKMNVMFDIACALTKSKGSDKKLARDWAQAARWFSTIPASSAIVELSPEVLNLLAALCKLQSRVYGAMSSPPGLSVNMKWHIASECDSMGVQMANLSLVCVRDEWSHHLQNTARELRVQALLHAATTLHRSRKKQDQVRERAILVKCLQLDSSNVEAQKMISEPLGRKDKSSLIDVPVEQFDENLFLNNVNEDEKEKDEKLLGVGDLSVDSILDTSTEHRYDTSMVDNSIVSSRGSDQSDNSTPDELPVKEREGSSSLLSGILPASTINVTFIMRVKLRSYVHESIITPLNESAETLRLALARTGIPVVMEFSHMPSTIPESLAPSNQVVPDLNSLKEKALRTPVSTEFTKLELKYQSIESLVSLPEKDIAALIGVQDKPAKKRSKPLFLERVQSLVASINELVSACEAESVDAITKVNKFSFPSLLGDAPPPASGQSEFTPVLRRAAATFDNAVRDAQTKHARALQLAKRLEEAQQAYVTRDAKFTPVSAVYTAYLLAAHTVHRMKLMKLDVDEYEKLSEAANTKEHKEVRTPPMQSFHWEPGNSIQFGP